MENEPIKSYEGYVNAYQLKTLTGSNFQIGPVYPNRKDAVDSVSPKGHIATLKIAFKTFSEEPDQCLLFSRCTGSIIRKKKLPFLECSVGFLLLDTVFRGGNSWPMWVIILYVLLTIVLLMGTLFNNTMIDLYNKETEPVDNKDGDKTSV